MTDAAASLTAGRRPSGRNGGLRYLLRVLAGRRLPRSSSSSTRLGARLRLVDREAAALFAVLYIVFGRFFKLDAGFEHYPLYLLIGIVLWTFFVDATHARA